MKKYLKKVKNLLAHIYALVYDIGRWRPQDLKNLEKKLKKSLTEKYLQWYDIQACSPEKEPIT